MVNDIRRVEAIGLMNSLSQCKISALTDKAKRMGLVIMMADLRRVGDELEAVRRESIGMLSEKEARETLEEWLQQTITIEAVQLSEDDIQALIEANKDLSCGQLSQLMLLIR